MMPAAATSESVSVDLPWSTCAITDMLRMLDGLFWITWSSSIVTARVWARAQRDNSSLGCAGDWGGASAAGSVQFTILTLFVLLGGSATRGDGESERRSEGRALPWGWPRAEVAI